MKAFSFGHKTTPECTFCNEEKQTFTHLFLTCPGVKIFRESLESHWNTELTAKEWFFGNENHDVSYLIRESNIYLHTTNWAGKALSRVQFYMHVQEIEKIEATIAERKNKLGVHLEKWRNKFEIMQMQL